MENIILLSDDHIRQESPFFESKQLFFDWVHNASWNNKNNILIHCGDLFHRANPSPKEYQLAFNFFSNVLFDKIYLIAGNGQHEYNYSRNSYAIDPLSSIKNVECIYKPKILDIDSVKILCLPWIPNKVYDDIDSMKEYYEDLPEEFVLPKYDYVLGHFASKEFFGDEINVEYLYGKKRMGHIHFPDETYLGANTITRYDEKGKDMFVHMIDCASKKESTILIPKFLEYEDIEYPTIPEEKEHEYRIYDIINAPDRKIAEEHYKDYHVHAIHLKEDHDISISERSTSASLTIPEYMDNFIKDKKVKKPLAKELKTTIKECTV